MEIKLYNDVVFKWIFGRQEHTSPLICLLNSVVCYEGEPPKFSKVQILNPFDKSEPFMNEKQGILDIRAKDTQSEEWIDIEVQVAYSEYYLQRSKYYLAGMYREQLKKSKEVNYYELKPCYGIHLLVDSIFKDERDKKYWFNHYAMLNVITHKPLVSHWHLYYIELNKFLNLFNKNDYTKELEQWSYFIGNIQDSSKGLDNFFDKNDAIKEVFEMLQTFTKDEQLKEQYRLHEEWLRVQRTEASIKERLQKQYLAEKWAKEEALRAKEEALRAKEQEKLDKEEALQKSENIKRSSIAILKKMGLSNEDISQSLSIPLSDVG